MYHRYNKQPNALSNAGFALATVLIASFSMMLILLASVSATVAIRSSITEQYYSKLAKTASDAGVEYAKACLAVNDGKPQWSGKNLTPGTDCKGDRISGAPDYVYTDGEHIRSTFSVSGTGLNANTRLDDISVSGHTDLTNSSQTDPVWRKYDYNAAVMRKPIFNEWLSVTNYTSCAPSSDNGVYCWGTNHYGLLGIGSDDESYSTSVPVAVKLSNLGAGETIKTVTSGYENVCIRTVVSPNSSEGYAYCWGSNSNGQLGNGSSGGFSSEPTKVGNFEGSLLKNVMISDIRIGLKHACALTLSPNRLFCWGNNYRGQLGIGSTSSTDTLSPVLVYDGNRNGDLNDKTISSLSIDHQTNCVIDSTGIGYCWGDNTFGQTGTNTPRQTTAISNPKKIAGDLTDVRLLALTTGMGHSCAITVDNKAYCWGYQLYGQLGDGVSGSDVDFPFPPGKYSIIPKQVSTSELPAGSILNSIDLGYYSGCLKYSNSTTDTIRRLACFGANTSGELGVGDYAIRAIPTKVSPSSTDKLFNKNVRRVSVATSHVCALTGDDVYCWGSNYYKQLGNNTIIGSSNTPVLVSQPPISNYY